MEVQPNPSLMEHAMSESEQGPVPNSTFGVERFRDKLMNKVNLEKNVGIDISSLDADYDDLNDDEDVQISHGERGPSIQFSDRAMDRLCKPWRNALIVRLQQKWSLKGAWKLVDLVNDYYVVKFDLKEDLNFVLTGGPWIIAGQYLIGNLLGKLLKIDSLTTAQNCGKFARLCVELDLTKPLEAFVQINQNWNNIEYEESTVGDDECSRGPWMNVQSRRRHKLDFEVFGGKGSGAKVKGSCFDALRNISDNFGTDEAVSDVFVEQDKSNFNSSFLPDMEHGKKVWTKTKNAKPVFRSALNDISNKPFEGKVPGDESVRKVVVLQKCLLELYLVLESWLFREISLIFLAL
ncbi:uncharacterized protein LOC110766368 [Prunus avium]|uniref:Uncharacterized protein LOC110766368 n=1 Tax=Prunus avium TaxID=42229 RepID=A0A6P5TE44_PRUAV|nr:uncharacterized protein LOC110766368 [Prunus avium]